MNAHNTVVSDGNWEISSEKQQFQVLKTIETLKLVSPEVPLEVYSKELIKDLGKYLCQLPFDKHIPGAMH